MDLELISEPAIKPKKERKISDVSKVVAHFVSVQFKDKYFYSREYGFAKKLIAKYGLEFLLQCPVPNGYKISSLVFFITGDGKDYLSGCLFEHSKQKMDLSIEIKPQILEAEKVGEDIILTNFKPKTLKDFLNYGKKN